MEDQAFSNRTQVPEVTPDKVKTIARSQVCNRIAFKCIISDFHCFQMPSDPKANLERGILIVKLLLALINLLNAHPHMDLLHVSDPLVSHGFSVLITTQVSSRELAGKPLQGYEKRKITYEVHNACLTNPFTADFCPTQNLSHDDVRKVCVLVAVVCSLLRS